MFRLMALLCTFISSVIIVLQWGKFILAILSHPHCGLQLPHPRFIFTVPSPSCSEPELNVVIAVLCKWNLPRKALSRTEVKNLGNQTFYVTFSTGCRRESRTKWSVGLDVGCSLSFAGCPCCIRECSRWEPV